MTTSEQIDRIAEAMAKAQRDMKNAPLNKVNPHFRSKYADLAGIRDAVIPALSTHGIAVVQTFGATPDGGNAVFTRLLHVSGQWVESACAVPPTPDMQKMGSAITYARRYSLSAICGIAADEDDDGNEAVMPPPASAQPAATAPAGYDAWLATLDGIADNGLSEWTAAWNASKPEYTRHLSMTAPKELAALKNRAAKARATR